MTAPLERALSIADLRELARRRLPPAWFDWADGGADDEVTLRANRAAFDGLALRPRYLVDVSRVDTTAVVCGTSVSLPVLLAPVGLNRILWPAGEVAAARAAGKAGTIYCLSSGSSVTLEDVARAATAPLWFQLYLWRDVHRTLLRRARESGYEALVVTVDVPASGRREREARHGLTLPPARTLRHTITVAARRPRWLLEHLRVPPVRLANLDDGGRGTATPLARRMAALHDPSATYETLSRVRDAWPGRLLVKGVLTAEDAEAAVRCGVDAVVVSNHGGRQLDSAPASLYVLPEIAAAVGDRVEVLLDGGVRRGSDVVKALSLGARAVLVGRPYLYGLAAAGEAGVAHALELLRRELETCLALTGRRAVSELDATLLMAATPSPWPP